MKVRVYIEATVEVGDGLEEEFLTDAVYEAMVKADPQEQFKLVNYDIVEEE
jgi:hypothetical protein